MSPDVLDKAGEPIPGLSHGRCLTLGSLIGKALATDTTVQAL